MHTNARMLSTPGRITCSRRRARRWLRAPRGAGSRSRPPRDRVAPAGVERERQQSERSDKQENGRRSMQKRVDGGDVRDVCRRGLLIKDEGHRWSEAAGNGEEREEPQPSNRKAENSGTSRDRMRGPPNPRIANSSMTTAALAPTIVYTPRSSASHGESATAASASHRS